MRKEKEDRPTHIESPQRDAMMPENDFVTTAHAVMRASGLRLTTIEAIAHKRGVRIDDIYHADIGADLLADLADAYLLKLKMYFRKAKRFAAELGHDEQSTFASFCATFKKSHVSEARTWDDIDADALREQFYKDVREATPTRQADRQCLSLFSGYIFRPDIIQALFRDNESSQIDLRCLAELADEPLTLRHTLPSSVLASVFTSVCYISNFKKRTREEAGQRQETRQALLSARFHIFVDEDEECHLRSKSDNKILSTCALWDGRIMAKPLERHNNGILQ